MAYLKDKLQIVLGVNSLFKILRQRLIVDNVSRETIVKKIGVLYKDKQFKKTFIIREKLGNVSRETILHQFNNLFSYFKNLFSKHSGKTGRSLLKALFIVIFVFFSFKLFLLINNRLTEDLIADNEKLPSNYAISDRIFYNNVSRETIYGNFLTGTGIGTFIFQIDEYLEKNNISEKLESWQYQPAHNIYFLIASEIGIVGLLLFLLFVFQVVFDSVKGIMSGLLRVFLESGKTIVSRETIFSPNFKLNYFLLAIFISFLFVGLFDHYFWTLQQGELMFWLVLGFLFLNVEGRNT
jgi:hypothetical protein